MGRLGGNKPDYRCVGPAPTPAPTPEEPIKCHTDHNPTYTPECPSGYTCQAVLGGNRENEGMCVKLSDRRRELRNKKGKKCQDPSTYNPTYTPQCIDQGEGFTCQNVRLGGNKPDFRCVGPAPTPPPTPEN